MRWGEWGPEHSFNGAAVSRPFGMYIDRIGRRDTRQDVIQTFQEALWLRQRHQGDPNDVLAIRILWPACKDARS